MGIGDWAQSPNKNIYRIFLIIILFKLKNYCNFLLNFIYLTKSMKDKKESDMVLPGQSIAKVKDGYMA